MLRESLDGDYVAPAPAVPIELKAILHEHGETFVIFNVGTTQRIIDAELRDLLPYDNFRRLVLDRLGIRVVYRRGRWFRDVVEAAERGGAVVTPEALARAIWINEAKLEWAEADYLAELILSEEVRAAG